MNYTVFIKNAPLKKGLYPVYIRISHLRRSKYLSLGINVKEKDWDKVKKLVKRSDILHHKKNLVIRSYSQKADQILLENIINNTPLSLDAVIKKLRNKNLINFFEFAQTVIKNKDVAKATLDGYNAAMNNMKNFRKETILTDIDTLYLSSFKNYLIKLGKEISTIKIYIAFISQIMNAAVKEQIILGNPCTDFKIDFVRNEKPYLTTNEIEILEKLADSNSLKPTFNNTLKMFLFSCYTGISISDLSKLTIDNIQTVIVDDNSYSMIFDNRQKTKNAFRVPLTQKALAIIDDLSTNTKTLFGSIISMTLSYHMEKIRLAAPEIKKHFTFHTARHSFGTYWASQGVSEKILMEMMGHTESASNRIYSKIQDFTLINSVLNPSK